MFKTEYNVLGSPLHGVVAPCRGTISREADYYSVIKRAAESRNWLYNRIETCDKRGMPDIFVTRGSEYWYVEVKRLRKKNLQSIEDDLHWQFGQLAFLKNCMRNRSRYILVVAHTNSALWLKGEYQDEHIDYPDFVKQL